MFIGGPFDASPSNQFSGASWLPIIATAHNTRYGTFDIIRCVVMDVIGTCRRLLCIYRPPRPWWAHLGDGAVDVGDDGGAGDREQTVQDD